MILDFIKNFLEKPTDLKTHLNQGKKVKIQGVIFYIRKIGVMDHLEGARVMQELFSVYKTKEQKNTQAKIDAGTEKTLKKAKTFMTDVIMAGVMKPKLSREEDCGEDIYVGDIFTDWALAQALTVAILEYTYGKKK